MILFPNLIFPGTFLLSSIPHTLNTISTNIKIRHNSTVKQNFKYKTVNDSEQIHIHESLSDLKLQALWELTQSDDILILVLNGIHLNYTTKSYMALQKICSTKNQEIDSFLDSCVSSTSGLFMTLTVLS